MDPKSNRLYEIAVTQAGYFTAQQASEAGYRYTNYSYYLQTGAWVREWRGIYRLAHFPEPDDGQYALWSLWSRMASFLCRARAAEKWYSHRRYCKRSSNA
jgi:hypothetical protein